MRVLAPALLAAALLSGCAGTSCDELDALREERDRERAGFLALVRSGASGDEVAAVDDRVHVLEARVADLEQSCG
ncbi:MAG TPA: hypothetical protein VNU66_11775 [Mycobacteriales bacterium]|nr:hypothetical protein [Mycobacteriales bacterium]